MNIKKYANLFVFTKDIKILQLTTLSDEKTYIILSAESLSTNSLSAMKDQRQTRSTTVKIKTNTQKQTQIVLHETDEKVQEIVKKLKTTFDNYFPTYLSDRPERLQEGRRSGL